MDIDLIMGSLELDSCVGLKTLKKKYKNSDSLTAAECKAFVDGYEKATSLLLGAMRNVLVDRLTSSPRVLSQPIFPHARSRQYRAEPLGWNIQDSNAAVIGARIKEIARSPQTPKPPAVIFDLDGTLVDVSFRTLGILKEWLASDRAELFPDGLVAKLAGIDLTHIGYSLAHAYENAGLDLREEDVARVFESTERHWRRRFFDGRALVEYDKPILGSQAFVWDLHRSGIEIVYLTGRNLQGMEKGTRKQMEVLGFPVAEAQFFLKPDYEKDDHLYKESIFREVSENFHIVGNFENEYINLKSMMESVNLDCLHVIVDSQHSGRPVPENESLVYRIFDYS